MNMAKKGNYKPGVYLLHKTPDIFKMEEPCGYIEIRLTSKEAKNLFNGELYEKLGFCGWSFIKD